MSVWATFWSADDEHARACAVWESISDHAVKIGNGPCTCRLRDAPIAYQGSHVLPDEDDQRGGYVGLALVPSHITRDGRDDQPDDGQPYPFVRLSVGQEDAVLDEQQAAAMHQALGEWLKERKAEQR